MANRIFIFLSLILAFNGEAQIWQRNASVPVQVDNYFLANPWMGGLNAPQFSNIDVNGDGTKDLFVFDRQGDRKLVFVQTSNTAGQSYWYHSPQFESLFPKLNTWALLRDMNCDGYEDIVTNYQSGLVLYINTTPITGVLSFEPYDNLQLLKSDYELGGGPFNAPLYCMSVDVPVIEDIDGDGDLDVLTNTESSTGIYYYQSQQSQNGSCDVVEFNCVNRCYGMVSEAAESFSLFIGDQFSCPLNVLNPKSKSAKHTGGTLAAIDLNGNGIKDLIIGDVTEPNLAAVYLVDTPQGPDSAVAFTTQFPMSPPVDLHLFPAAYYEDVTNDGVSDLLVAPNAIFGAEDRKSVWLYINQGTESQPDWIFSSTDFLQNQSIDVGVGAHPVSADVDGDGDLDVLLAARYYDTENLTNKSCIHLLRNDTINGQWQLNWISQDWMNLSSLNFQNIYPSWGDWDNDGDGDLILGELNGNLYLVRNIGTSLSTAFGAPQLLSDAAGTVIDLGQSSTPLLVDINQDGLMDLVVGEKSGNVNFYKNVGTAQVPSWSLVTENLAGAQASSYLGLDGFSVPALVKGEGNLWDLYLGCEKGWVNHFQFQSNLPNVGQLIDEQWQDIREGDRSSVVFGDFSGEGSLDMLMGHSGGGLAFFTTDSVAITVTENNKRDVWTVYPNPGNDVLVAGPFDDDQMMITIFDVLGRTIEKSAVSSEWMRLDSSAWNSGFFLVVIEGRNQREVKLWLKK
jgi:hypothetical protein